MCFAPFKSLRGGTFLLIVLSPHLLHEPLPFPLTLSQFRQHGVLIRSDSGRFLRDRKKMINQRGLILGSPESGES